MARPSAATDSSSPAVIREGRTPRSRLADLLIAATAHANGLDLYPRNCDDYAGLEELVHVVAA